MSAAFEIINGFRCYAPQLAQATADYPREGFEITAGIEAQSFWCRTRNRILRQVFMRFTDRSRPLDVLEIGCGIGGVLRELQSIPNLRLTGAEVSLEGLSFARASLPDVDFIQLDATSLPFREEFDVIGAFDVLEHIDADEAVIQQVHKALRPRGMFIITVPQYQWMWSTHDELFRHKRRYDRRLLAARLEPAGFELIYVTSFITALFPLMMAARLFDRRHAAVENTGTAITTHVDLSPAVNWIFDKVMRVDELALRLGVVLPFGGSLLAVAVKS